MNPGVVFTFGAGRYNDLLLVQLNQKWIIRPIERSLWGEARVFVSKRGGKKVIWWELMGMGGGEGG